MNRTQPTPCPTDRDRGAATVAALTLMFAFMAGAFVWLSTAVDRSLHDRGQAAAVAFQAARSGAQAIDEQAARAGRLELDAARAEQAVRATVARLLAANGDAGRLVSVRLDGVRVIVTVEISTTGRSVTGTGTASARLSFDGVHA